MRPPRATAAPRRLVAASLALLGPVVAPAVAGGQGAPPRVAPSTAPSTATSAPEAATAAALAAIRAEGLGERSRVVETATVLSDVFGPRLAGSAAYRQAAEWARAAMQRDGLTARLEPWGTRGGARWRPVRHSVELTAPYYARLAAHPWAWSPGTAGPVRGTPVLVEEPLRTPDDVARLAPRLRGRIVLLGALPPLPDSVRMAPGATRWSDAQLDSLDRLTDPGSPRDYAEDSEGYAERVRARRAVSVALRRAGVRAVLTPSANPFSPMVGGYQAYDGRVDDAVPAFTLAREDYGRLVHLLRYAAVGGRPAPVVALDLATATERPRTRADSTGYNVIAELAGSDPTLAAEVVMVGGHFDSWTAGTGAADNAAGAAVAMEAVRLVAHAARVTGTRPRRTIRVALWDGEEHEDYFGSLGWVRRHLGDPLTGRRGPEHARVSAYFNFDNGSGRIRGVWLQGNAAARPLVAGMLAPFADLGAAHTTLANTGSTDHMPFVGVGVPGFTFLQDPLDYHTRVHHTAADVAANLQAADLRQAATVTAGVLWQAANLAARLPRASSPTRPAESAPGTTSPSP